MCTDPNSFPASNPYQGRNIEIRNTIPPPKMILSGVLSLLMSKEAKVLRLLLRGPSPDASSAHHNPQRAGRGGIGCGACGSACSRPGAERTSKPSSTPG